MWGDFARADNTRVLPTTVFARFPGFVFASASAGGSGGSGGAGRAPGGGGVPKKNKNPTAMWGKKPKILNLISPKPYKKP